VTLNPAPDCSSVLPVITSESCVGVVGSACIVKAMTTKLRVLLTDDIGAVTGCKDDDGPINYRLVALRGECSTSAAGHLLATAYSPYFSGISVASGVRSLAFEAVDVHGAVSRVCLPQFTVSDVSVDDLSSLVNGNGTMASLAGDRQGQQRFASNVVASLLSLYSSNADSAALPAIKDSAFALLKSASSSITDPSTAAQSAATLFSLISLPGSVSSASSVAAVGMIENIATSSLVMLNSGVASRDLAVEISPMLVGGSASLLKSVSLSSTRRLLGYKTGMEAALSAVLNAAKVQVHALAAAQDAIVQDQSPSAVVTIRRLASSGFLQSLYLPLPLLE
jgi:hypothetical protein